MIIIEVLQTGYHGYLKNMSTDLLGRRIHGNGESGSEKDWVRPNEAFLGSVWICGLVCDGVQVSDWQ